MRKFGSFGMLSALLLLGLPATSFAADLRGDEFITTMDGNSIAGINDAGLAFNLYFLSGGLVTYSDVTGTKANGKWLLDRSGDVCIEWQKPVGALDGCFRMSFDGNTVIWHSNKVSGRGTLRGGVAETFPKPAR